MSDSANTSTAQGPYRTLANDLPKAVERRWKRWFVGMLGVFLPIAVLTIELGAGWCKEVLFDPVPTAVHAFLVALVPLANAVALSRAALRFPWTQRALNGAALIITLVYALVFLPIMPIALLAILYLGLGFLPLSPAFALAATLMARHLITGRTLFDPAPRFAPRLAGALAAAALFGVAALPPLLTQYGLRLATDPDAQTAQRGREFLRRFAATDNLLATCAQNIGRRSNSPLTLGFVFGEPVSAEDAAEVFYRVTGQVCRTRDFDGEAPFRSRGFDTVAEDPSGPDRKSNVKLVSSRFDATVDARAAVAYTEWTLVFHNDASWQQEATAELELPKDAVISRATLWIDGEPREAAFASRAQAREAYERVVSRRKDPLLVTSTGRGRAQLRCFPVPPHGEMKILVGITAPLAIEDPNVAWLALPSMIQRNFSMGAAHRLWVEAKQPFQLDGVRARPAAGGFSLDQNMPLAALEPGRSLLRFERNGASAEAWSIDPTDALQVVTQRVETYRESALGRLSIVLDTSLRQEQVTAALRAALADLAPGTELSVLAAGDSAAIELCSRRRVDAALLKDLDAALSKLSFEGGADNVPALVQAVERSNPDEKTAILWLHGPQPYLFEHPERVRQVLERAGGRVSLFELQTSLGRNRAVEELEGAPGFTTLTRRGELDATLRRQFKEWSGAVRYRAIRQSEPRSAAGAPSLKTSDHLARLWAYEEVERLALGRNREQALKLASAYKLVTTVSGAVVLETAQQYADAGLVPPTAENVPSVPEPAFWVLIGCAVAFLVFTLVAARRLKKSETACA